MKPRPFAYLRPSSVAEAIAALAEHGEAARIVAGGQSLMPMLNFRLAETPLLLDIGRLAELDHITPHADCLEIGAAVTQAKLLAWPDLARHVPLLAQALPWVGHFQTRNRGTVCGSLAHADPSSELPLILATLGGEVVLRSARGTRVLGAAEFQTGLLGTARAPDELITACRFPTGGGPASFREVSRRHGDFAILAVAAVASPGGVRLGVGGLAERPAVATLRHDDLPAQLNALAWDLRGTDDIHATAHYRRDLLRRLGRSVIEEVLACAA